MVVNYLPDEKELLIKLQQGDYTAFDEIYNRYKKRITINLFALLKERDLVEEALQELFSRVWEKRQQIDPKRPLQAYLYRIAANLATDHFRRLARNQHLAEQFWQTWQEQYIDRSDAALQKVMDEALFNVIEKLPAQRKRVFMLCKFEAKSYDEVSRMLNISVAAVNDHITKANRFLRQHYNYEVLPAALIVASYILK